MLLEVAEHSPEARAWAQEQCLKRLPVDDYFALHTALKESHYHQQMFDLLPIRWHNDLCLQINASDHDLNDRIYADWVLQQSLDVQIEWTLAGYRSSLDRDNWFVKQILLNDLFATGDFARHLPWIEQGGMADQVL